MLKQSRNLFVQGLGKVRKLFCSPFIGAWNEMKATAHIPSEATWKELVHNDVAIFLAPMRGAIRGFSRVIYKIWNTDEIEKP